MSEGQRSIPKFASFKPKVQPAPPPDPVQRDETRKGDDRRRRHRSRDERESHFHRRRSPRESDPNSHGRQRHRSRSSEHKRRRITPNVEPAAEPLVIPWDDEKLYIADRKGDLGNLQYGRLHKYNIPPYRRIGYGRVLGAPPHLKINRALSTDKEIVLTSRFQTDDMDSQQSLRRQKIPKDAETRRVVARSETNPEEELAADVIHFGRRRRQNELQVAPSASLMLASSVLGATSGLSYPGGAEDSSSDSDEPALDASMDEDPGRPNREKNAVLTKRTKDEPRNVDAWLDLIEHQTLLITGNTYTSTRSEEVSVAEIRLDLYNTALKHFTLGEQAYDRLLIGMLDEGMKVWSSERLTQELERILEKSPLNFELRKRHIDFVQTSFSQYNHSECHNIFIATIKAVGNLLEKPGLTESAKAEIRLLKLYFFTRMTVYLQETGYQELAIALWQALLEYTFFKPPHNVLDTKADMSSILDASELASYGDFWEAGSFEKFWESEVPRIGENGAKGWADFVVNEGEPPEPDMRMHDMDVDEREPFRSFAELESASTKLLQLPGRSLDEAGKDDPYHMVLVTDIMEILEAVRDSYDHTLLVNAFLCFCHLPPLASLDPTATPFSWWLDSFFRNCTVVTRLSDHLPYCITTQELLFNADANLNPSCPPDFVRNVLKSLGQGRGGKPIMEYHLALESLHFPDTAAKLTKYLIKKTPSELYLYGIYALIEITKSNWPVAQRTLVTALQMGASRDGSQQPDAFLLWKTLIWHTLLNDGPEAALRAAVAIGNPSTLASLLTEPNAASILRAKTILTEATESAVSLVARAGTSSQSTKSTYTHEHILAVTDCLAYLIYLLEFPSLDPSITIITRTATLLTTCSLQNTPLHEALHQSIATLIKYHTTHNHPFHPATIRSLLQKSLSLFPHNTLLLSTFRTTESRFRLDDRLRTALSATLHNEKENTVVDWLFLLSTEMSRRVELGGTQHAIRAVFERAVTSKSGRHSVEIWRRYVLFELRTGGGKKRAREVFLRGVGKVPWGKGFYMVAFGGLRDEGDGDGGLKEEELRVVYNTMVEKGVRTYVDLGDVLDGFRAKGNISRG